MSLLKTKSDSLPIKGILGNVAMEKRNAQLICGADGSGLDFVIETALRNSDPLLMKVARNISMHEGPMQQHFVVSLMESNGV
jgi:hypothetical protein